LSGERGFESIRNMMTKTQSKPSPEMLELYKLLLKSEKFISWKPTPLRPQDPAVSGTTERALEKHYSASEVAEVWGISADLVRNIFRREPDVVALDRTGRGKYITLRIPESVMIRVHRRLSQG
jgi:hypothetical protein